MKRERNAGFILVSPQLLEQRLMIPEGHKIIGVKWDMARQIIKVFIDGETLPLIPEGGIPPQVILHHSSDNETGYFK